MGLLDKVLGRAHNTSKGPSLLKLAELKLQEQPLPTELVGSYRLDYDLWYGDRTVRTALSRAVKDIPNLTDKIAKLDHAIAKAPNRVERLALERDKDELQQDLINRQFQQAQYDQIAPALLQEYQDCPRPAPVEIGQDVVLTEADYQRIDIIERWLRLAANYIPVRVVRELTPSDRCPVCEELYVTENDETYCPGCNVLVSRNESDEQHYNPNQAAPKKKNYDLVGNLRKTYHRLQGSSDVKIPYDEMVVLFDKHLAKYGWTKASLSKDQLIDMLKLYDFSEYYPDINYIMHLYTGAPLPDYNEYEDRVMERYNLFLQVYDEIEKARTSALNGQYLIHKLLQLEGCMTNPADFKMTKGYETLCEYERIWKEACRKLGGAENGWPFIASFVNED